jgi:hypothetical protein
MTQSDGRVTARRSTQCRRLQQANVTASGGRDRRFIPQSHSTNGDVAPSFCPKTPVGVSARGRKTGCSRNALGNQVDCRILCPQHLPRRYAPTLRGRATSKPAPAYVPNPNAKAWRLYPRLRIGVGGSLHHEHRLAQHVRAGADAQAGSGGGCHPTVDAPQRPVRDAHRDVTVEVGRREQQLGRRAVSQVGERRRHDVAAPAVLQRHGNAQRHAQVAGRGRRQGIGRLGSFCPGMRHTVITLGPPRRPTTRRFRKYTSDCRRGGPQ